MKQQQQNLKPLDKTPQELLIEIRNLLTPHYQENTHKHLTPNQIDQILKDSYDHSQVLKKMPSLKPITQQKIQEATTLLQQKNHSNFIQQYTKHKINSQMFSPLRNNISQSEQQYYQKQRQQLLRQRYLQEQQEIERQKNIIETTKKFIRHQSYKLPYAEISQLTLKQGNQSITYLLNQAPDNTQASINNKIDQSRASNLEAKYQEMKNSQLSQVSSKKIEPNIKQEDFIQVFDQDQSITEQSMKKRLENNLFEALKRSPKFVKVFRQIIINHLTLQQLLNDQSSSKYRSSLNRSQSCFKYKNSSMLIAKRISQPSAQTVSSLTKRYRSKGIVLKQMGFRANFKQSKLICAKIINKMVGDSTQYHPKKAVLTENELLWCQEKEQIKQDTKKVILTIQNIKVEKRRKEEGSFFSKISTQLDVVIVEGTNRNLIFEKKYLEGSQLFQQLCLLMARKIYNVNIIIACKLNQNLYDFIYNKKATTFDLSNEFLQSHDKYPTRQYRLMIISILISLFPFRNDITRLNLNCCRTNIEENNLIFKNLSFNRIQEIVISQTKFNAESLSLIANFISTLPSNRLDVTLCNCMIDDTILIKSAESIHKCVNIHKLNISINSFGINGFSAILQLCSQEKSSLAELNISQNMIVNLAVIGELIKKCKRLQVLIAESCGFSFQSDEQLRQFFQNCRNSKLKKLSLLRNQLVNNLKYFQDFWVNDTPKEISVDLGIYTQKTSKNLQGRLL